MNQFPPPPPGAPPPMPGAPLPSEKLAMVSMILGILGVTLFACFTGVPAIICGHIARGRIERSAGTLGGRGQATTGIVLGYLSIVGTLIMAGTIWFVWKQTPAIQSSTAQPIVSSQAAEIASALEKYRASNGKLPPLTGTNGEQVDTAALAGALKAGGHYEPSKNGFAVHDVPSDLWLQPLNVAIDLNADGKVEVGTQQITGTVAVWSSGPNKKNELGAGDDVRSW